MDFMYTSVSNFNKTERKASQIRFTFFEKSLNFIKGDEFFFFDKKIRKKKQEMSFNPYFCWDC